MREVNSNHRHRVDWVLRRRFPGLTRRHVEEALERTLVLGPKGSCLSKGDFVDADSLLDTSRLESHLQALAQGNPDLAVEIVFECPEFWVIDKPAGMPGHPVSLFDTQTVTHWALARLPSIASGFPAVQPILTPHRLDTGTSGVLVVAKTRSAFEVWRERFSKKQVVKTYQAWCWGKPDREKWVVDSPIGKAKGRPGRMCVGGKEPRPALSQVEVISRESDRFLAEVVCRTGVTHQVRVHLAACGFPLIGDTTYDPNFASRQNHPPYHLLRAVRLEL